MNKLTEVEFLDFYSKAYGELTDKLGQIAYHKFTGEELFEFVNDAIEYWAKNQRSGYDTEIKRDFNSYYCKPPILVDLVRVPESSPNGDIPTVNNQDYFGNIVSILKTNHMISELTYLRSLANREPIVRKEYDMPIIFSKPTEHVHSWCNSGISVQGIPLLACTTCGETKRINI